MHLSTAIHVWELQEQPLSFNLIHRELRKKQAEAVFVQFINSKSDQKEYSSSVVLVESWAFDRILLITSISVQWYLFSAENWSWSSDHNPSYYDSVTLLKSFIYLLWLSYTLPFRLRYPPLVCCTHVTAAMHHFPVQIKCKKRIHWSTYLWQGT